MTHSRSVGRRVTLLAIVVLSVGTLILATRGLPPATPNPSGTFAFGAFGDAPYDPLESWRYPLLLRDLDQHDLGFAIHVGDIFWRPCSPERYERSLRWFEGLKHPLIYVPGDNEWADCWTAQEGGFNPRDRLALLRRIMYPRPGFALGLERFPLETQSTDPQFSEFVEHARWSTNAIVFATLHVVGSENFTAPFPARTSEDDAEARRRLESALVWLRGTFYQATSQSANAVVLAFHADPGFQWSSGNPYQALLDAFAEAASAFGKPVLLIHGDMHDFIVDTPLKERATGRTIGNVTRLEVPGSPDVSWVRVVVTPGETPSFAFERRDVPFWKYW